MGEVIALLVVIAAVIAVAIGVKNTAGEPGAKTAHEPGTKVIEWSSISVLDGDTVRIGDERLRLWGVDAPESNQPWGKEATDALRSYLAEAQKVRVRTFWKDKYGRPLIILSEAGTRRSLNKRLVEEGYAWSFMDKGRYAEAEQTARAAKRGLWSDREAVPPVEWRSREAA